MLENRILKLLAGGRVSRNTTNVKCRSGANGLNEELGRHRDKNDDRRCKLCGCESVVLFSGSVLCMILLEILLWKT